MTVDTALRQGTRLLEDGGVPVPRLTAEVLLCHALHQERSFLYAHPEHELSQVAWLHYGRYLHQRLQGTPTQYITRKQEFYGRDFRVTPDVLIPRPETEHVIEAVLGVAPEAKSVLDVGAGSGAIAVTLCLELNATTTATDISPAALRIAADNARRLGAGVHFVLCDLASAIASRSLDLLVSNPPYVPLADKTGLQREVRDFEPSVALFAGPTGHEVYQRLVTEAARVLRPGGWMVLELGYRSLDPVRAMLDSDWSQAQVTGDLAGIPRVLAARYSP